MAAHEADLVKQDGTQSVIPSLLLPPSALPAPSIAPRFRQRPFLERAWILESHRAVFASFYLVSQARHLVLQIRVSLAEMGVRYHVPHFLLASLGLCFVSWHTYA